MKSFLLALAFLFYGSKAAPKSLEEKIKRVENGLIQSPVLIKGQPVNPRNLEKVMKDVGVPGLSIAVISNYQIEWAKAYGVVDVENGLSVTTDTLFQAASISKSVAALALLQLVDQNKIDLYQPVNNYLTSWKLPKSSFTANHPVTIRHLLNHTSGLNVSGFPGYQQGVTLPTLTQILDGEVPSNTPGLQVERIPGSKWRYSGGGYTVLQQLVEDVTRADFSSHMQSSVFQSLGMTSSLYSKSLPKELKNKTALGHQDGDTVVEGGWNNYPELAAAGLWATPSDLARFVIAVQKSVLGKANALVSKKTISEMFQSPVEAYGLGVQVIGSGQSLRFQHFGANQGYRCFYVGFPYTGHGVVIMTNSEVGISVAYELARSVAREYQWPGYVPVHAPVTVPKEALAQWVGTYKLDPERKISITVEAGRFFAELQSAESNWKRELIPESRTEFFSLTTTDSISFRRESKGKAISLVWHRLGFDQSATKMSK